MSTSIIVSLLRIYSSARFPADDPLILEFTLVSAIPLIPLLNQSTRRRTIALPPCSLQYHPLASCCSLHYTAGVRIDGNYSLRISVCLPLALIACHERHLTTTTPAAIFDALYIAEPTPTPQLRSSSLANRDNRYYRGRIRRDLHQTARKNQLDTAWGSTPRYKPATSYGAALGGESQESHQYEHTYQQGFASWERLQCLKSGHGNDLHRGPRRNSHKLRSTPSHSYRRWPLINIRNGIQQAKHRLKHHIPLPPVLPPRPNTP